MVEMFTLEKCFLGGGKSRISYVYHCLPLLYLGEDVQSDSYFSNELKPPTSCFILVKNIVIALSILDLGNGMVFEVFGHLNLESWEGLL